MLASIAKMIFALKRISLKKKKLLIFQMNTCGDKEIQYDNCQGMKYDAESDCLSNKCVNKHYIYNEMEPINHFDDIYIPPKFIIKENSYIYSSKTWGCQCEGNDVYSSKNGNDGCTLLRFLRFYFEGSTSNNPIY